VDGVGSGSVLGGRYSTNRRLAQRYGTERWSAHDLTLGRDVEVLCLPGDDPRSDPLLDAARRAAAIDSPRLVRILDVGRDGDVAFVIEEDLSDCHTLSSLVATGGLPADEVRRITGETATALDAAAQRGLHHLALTPLDVLRTPEGEVKLRGVATAAVCAGKDDVEAEEADRRDAIGIVAVAYAGLTGLWPRAGAETGGLRHAPRVPTGWAAPSELASGVPRDLDALCRLTLNEDQGPLSPGDYARQIAPWSATPLAMSPQARPDLPAALGSGPSSGDSTVVLPVTAPTPPAVAAGAPAGGVPSAGSTAGLAGAAAGTAAGATGTAAAAAPGLAAGVGTAAAAAAGASAAALSSAGSALSGAGTVAAEAVGRAGDRIGSVARKVGKRAANLGSGDDEESPAPMIPSQPLSRDESRVALAIVAAFVVLALIVGIWGVSRIGSHSTIDLGSGATGQTSTSASPSSSSSGSSTATDSATLQPLAILSADGFDPLGDQHENDSLAPKVFDGNPSTEWTSERYNTADFGGLKKGVGVIVDLGPNVHAKEVSLILPVAADVTVYLADERSLSSATAIGSQKNAQGTVTFPVPSGVTGQYIIVWFTKLTQDSKGEYRAHLAEVIPRG